MSLVRVPLMESSNNYVPGPEVQAGASRRSGRVSKAPEKFVPDAPAAAKRKRDLDHNGEDAENLSPDEDEESPNSDASAEGSDEDEEELELPRKKKQPAKPSSVRKPAAKKPKINGDATRASDGQVADLVSRPKKVARIAVQHREGANLYSEIFGSGDSSDDVAAHWYQKYQEDNAAAVTDLVNCILMSAGCDQLVTEDDIRDPENCQNRLADLQNVYAEEGITDYPLISRTKTTRSFRELLVGFFKSLVNVMHETEVLYKDDALMENIARWVASMSSSTLRPFRHTATTVALAMETALVEVAKKLDGRITKTTQQIEAEKKRKGKNKDRLAAVQKDLDEATRNREICQDQIKDFFDTVFVHRYRDIDPRIRSECVDALGSWIWILPTVFMEPEYLRYLGWMLSDITPQTRHEVLKQLARIFKRDADKLGHFIDRFRPRLVEMATKDSDISTRVTAISVIETLKSTGMLEPDEIDAIGKLIFDAEVRIRKAVVDFFADCVNDAIESKVEDMGGNESVDEIFGEEQADDYTTPRRDWISIKCLAEILAAYDAQFESERPTEPPRPLDIAVEMLSEVVPETRISLAAQVLFEKIEQIRNWELLAGYLLYDHTASAKSRSKSKARSNEAALRAAVAPGEGEEHILLEALASAVKVTLAHNPAETRKQQPKLDAAESQEESALRLASAIPRLLKKFGADPSTATTVLRLEHFLDLDIFQQLRQDSNTYDVLLDEICTQFNRHADRGVIAEATAALLHARGYDDLEELVNGKVAVLWENVINSLRNFDKLCELSERGNMDVLTVAELGHILMKISKLAQAVNPVDVLTAPGPTDESTAPAIDLLVNVVHRGKIAQVDEELDDLEDEAVAFAIKACHFYFMWKVAALISSVQSGSTVSDVEIDRLNALRQTYQANLISTFSSRGTNDDLRLFSTGALCDLHVLFASLTAPIAQAPRGTQKYAGLSALITEIPPGLVGTELIDIFDAAERAYAKRAKKTLNEPADDEEPIDDDHLLSDDEDDEDDGENDRDASSADIRKGRELKAEKSLCELASKYVMAILAKTLDVSGSQAGRLRRRMLRNRNKLGNNFKEVVDYLDEAKLAEKLSGSGGSRKRGKTSAAKGKQPAAGEGYRRAHSSASAATPRPVTVAETVAVEDDESNEENLPEEGTEEDLRRRELLDPVRDDEEDSAAGKEQQYPGDKDAESVLGD
ncbi:hypothetical protein VTK73DRAFT_7069 [Phialemonium thermophilum]|uniref:SCD domain-containing protein n=1 Tax=Phialemonium thermophilum TaxID=223376 RepID=A0ABR3WGX8_9PEZI